LKAEACLFKAEAFAFQSQEEPAMKRLIIVISAGMAAVGAISAAGAQGRDASDRGLRLEHDELRNDALQERQKRNQNPGLFEQWRQGEPNSNNDRKSKQSKQQK
jgi:hypothetical protein